MHFRNFSVFWCAVMISVLLPGVGLAEPLVGQGVGNADTFVSEGTRLFNRKQYVKAADQFLKATRANPSLVATYLQLARAAMLAKDLDRSCYSYRVFLKASGESPDRKKAMAESDQCERQLKSAVKPGAKDSTQQFVEGRAAFFAALDRQGIIDDGGAADSLAALVKGGYLGPDLADMASKLGASAIAQAETIFGQALSGVEPSIATLRSARPLYQVAYDVGVPMTDAKGRMQFLDGLAEFSEGDFKKAETLFNSAAKLEPKNHEYSFFRGLAVFRAGDRQGALKILEAALPDDPRTEVLRVALSIQNGADSGAASLEKLLFSRRHRPEK